MTDTPLHESSCIAWDLVLLPDAHLILVVDPAESVRLAPGDLVQLTTMTGSTYCVARDPVEGRYWLTAENVATERSRALRRGAMWEIRPPLMAVGLPALLLAPEAFARDDPRRVPGGGKRTSLVRQAAIYRGAVMPATEQTPAREAHDVATPHALHPLDRT